MKPQVQLTAAQQAKRRWDEACAKQEENDKQASRQAPWGTDNNGPPSPAQRIKANPNPNPNPNPNLN